MVVWNAGGVDIFRFGASSEPTIMNVSHQVPMEWSDMEEPYKECAKGQDLVIVTLIHLMEGIDGATQELNPVVAVFVYGCSTFGGFFMSDVAAGLNGPCTSTETVPFYSAAAV